MSKPFSIFLKYFSTTTLFFHFQKFSPLSNLVKLSVEPGCGLGEQPFSGVENRDVVERLSSYNVYSKTRGFDDYNMIGSSKYWKLKKPEELLMFKYKEGTGEWLIDGWVIDGW